MTRLDFVEGLHRLAQFFDEHPDVPLPDQPTLQYTVDADYPEQGVDRLDDLAAVLSDYWDETSLTRREPYAGGRHHVAEARFGPVRYIAVYIEPLAAEVTG